MLAYLKADPGGNGAGGMLWVYGNNGGGVLSGACKTASQFVRGWPMT